MGNGVAVAFSNVGLSRGSRQLANGLNLTISKGQAVAVVGRSGCGKTTLLLTIAGLIPCSGRREVDGDVGLVLQSHAIFPWMSVAENLAFGLLDRPREERQALVSQLLERTGLTKAAHRYPHQLSGGEQQRVAVARSIAVDPSILLLDEPFGALDAVTRESMQQWFLDLRAERPGMTSVLVTHSIDEALLLSDRIFVLRDGALSSDHLVHPLERSSSSDDGVAARLAFKKALAD